MSALFALILSNPSLANPIDVSTAAELNDAVSNAVAGDVITLAPGTYRVSSRLQAYANGTVSEPITVTAAVPSETSIEMDTVEGFHVRGAHWQFDGLQITGVCGDDSRCEHAFHIVGDADGTVIRGSVLSNFNAQIKSNGHSGAFPDDVLVEGNEMYNDDARHTSNPVVPIDVVGGQRWTVRSNYLHDIAKAGGDRISYAAFLKGHGADGLIENNLVVCEALHAGQIRLGLSLGGGGTFPDSVCEGGDCSVEHVGGVLRNNIIVDCPADVGIYLNGAEDTQVLHNVLYNTTGIDVRFATSSAELVGNVLDGRIRERDGGTATTRANLAQFTDFHMAFEDASALDFRVADSSELADLGGSRVTHDFCWNERDGAADLGALEVGSDCDTTRPHLPSSVADDLDPSSPEPDDTLSDPGSDDDLDPVDPVPLEGGCGCQSTSPIDLFWAVVPLLALRRRSATR